MWIFNCTGVGTPHPHGVQGSTLIQLQTELELGPEEGSCVGRHQALWGVMQARPRAASFLGRKERGGG